MFKFITSPILAMFGILSVKNHRRRRLLPRPPKSYASGEFEKRLEKQGFRITGPGFDSGFANRYVYIGRECFLIASLLERGAEFLGTIFVGRTGSCDYCCGHTLYQGYAIAPRPVPAGGRDLGLHDLVPAFRCCSHCSRLEARDCPGVPESMRSSKNIHEWLASQEGGSLQDTAKRRLAYLREELGRYEACVDRLRGEIAREATHLGGADAYRTSLLVAPDERSALKTIP